MKQKELSFHNFPQDDTLRKKWIIKIERKDFDQLNTTGYHFKNGKKVGSTDLQVYL